MTGEGRTNGGAELRAALVRCRALFAAALLFSAFVNMLMLTGPLFMLQVYDRVLVSRSIETLTALFLLIVFLFAVMGVLDHVRARLMARVGARVQADLEGRVFAVGLRRAVTAPGDARAQSGVRDLDHLGRLLASPVVLALFDMPWVPIFFAAIFFFHTWLGWLSLAGVMVLAATAALNQALTAPALIAAARAQLATERMAEQLRADAGVIRALGMQKAAGRRWRKVRESAARALLHASDFGGGFATFSRTFRLFLQSAMLALGAWVVLRGEMSGGAMIAGSILMGRALAPVEQVIGGWPMVVAARDGWGRLAVLLSVEPERDPLTRLPRPRACLELRGVAAAPPNAVAPVLELVSLRLEPGQALGIIGASGSGKSTFARTVCGIWPPLLGDIRLDGATLDQYDPDTLGQVIGYLPQRVGLYEGTIAENIARFGSVGDGRSVVAAAERAAAHRMILTLPSGYDTVVGPNGEGLSGGQLQRIGLARALFGDPALLVLDEPDASLDAEGGDAVKAAIRSVKRSGGAVLVMAHRPAAIAECEQLLLLTVGEPPVIGARDEVLRGMMHTAGASVRHARGLG